MVSGAAGEERRGLGRRGPLPLPANVTSWRPVQSPTRGPGLPSEIQATADDITPSQGLKSPRVRGPVSFSPCCLMTPSLGPPGEPCPHSLKVSIRRRSQGKGWRTWGREGRAGLSSWVHFIHGCVFRVWHRVEEWECMMLAGRSYRAQSVCPDVCGSMAAGGSEDGQKKLALACRLLRGGLLGR